MRDQWRGKENKANSRMRKLIREGPPRSKKHQMREPAWKTDKHKSIVAREAEISRTLVVAVVSDPQDECGLPAKQENCNPTDQVLTDNQINRLLNIKAHFLSQPYTIVWTVRSRCFSYLQEIHQWFSYPTLKLPYHQIRLTLWWQEKANYTSFWIAIFLGLEEC